MLDETLTPQIRAPGKAMLVGEYIVLDGGPAVVAAVNCYAKASLLPSTEPSPTPLIEAAASLATEAIKSQNLPASRIIPSVDTQDFFQQQQKLGLGSSAAAVVSTVATVYHASGFSLSSVSVRSEIQHVAFKAHQKIQGIVGSGADIVASTWGGLQVLNSVIQPSYPLPARFRLVTTPTSASTPQLIQRYRKAGHKINSASGQLLRAAEYFLLAWQEHRLDLLLFAIEMAFEGYLALGAVLNFPLITLEHQLIHDLAQTVGGAAKPSGSGGGDIAVVFFPSIEAEAKFQSRLPKPLRMLHLSLDSLGVHVWPR